MKKDIAYLLLLLAGFYAYLERDRWLPKLWTPHLWQTFNAIDGKFAVDFPAPPTAVIPSAQDPWSVHTIRAFDDYGSSYECSYLSDPRITAKSPQSVFAAVQEAAQKGENWRILFQVNHDVVGYPSSDIQAEGPDNQVIHQRILIVHDRIYRLLVTVPDGSSTDKASVDRFFNSLRLSN